jgi:hypothetical protein
MKKDEPEAVSTPVPIEKEEITDRDSKEGVSAPTNTSSKSATSKETAEVSYDLSPSIVLMNPEDGSLLLYYHITTQTNKDPNGSSR